jgi:hypothetical protein
VDEGGGEGGEMLDSPFPWVAIIVPSLLVVRSFPPPADL